MSHLPSLTGWVGGGSERKASFPADVTRGPLLLILGPMLFSPISIGFGGFRLGIWEKDFLSAPLLTF